MLHTKNGYNWPCSFQVEVKNVKLLMHDDRRGPIAISHFSDPGDLKNVAWINNVHVIMWIKVHYN